MTAPRTSASPPTALDASLEACFDAARRAVLPDPERGALARLDAARALAAVMPLLRRHERRLTDYLAAIEGCLDDRDVIATLLSALDADRDERLERGVGRLARKARWRGDRPVFVVLVFWLLKRRSRARGLTRSQCLLAARYCLEQRDEISYRRIMIEWGRRRDDHHWLTQLAEPGGEFHGCSRVDASRVLPPNRATSVFDGDMRRVLAKVMR